MTDFSSFARWLTSLKPRRHRRNRRQLHQQPPVQAECCEPRCLLAATVTQAIPDLQFADSATEHRIALSEHFDDTAVDGSVVRIETTQGTFYVQTFDSITPVTASNFLTLVDDANYADSFIHRSVPGFVVQGGGFVWPDGGDVGSVAHNGTIVNEFSNWYDPELGGKATGAPLNVRGTLAMAKVGGNPDSATSQWFVNTGNNAANLDSQNGGFTVFAEVLYDGMNVVDAVNALPLVDAQGAFSSLPLQDYVSGNIQPENIVFTSLSRVSELTWTVQSSDETVATAEIIDGELVVTPGTIRNTTAEITVEAADLAGNTVTETFEVIIPDLPAVPEVTGPAAAAARRPTITWNSADRAEHYELWVRQIGGPYSFVRENSVAETSWTPDQDFSSGDYIAWVRAVNVSGPGLWSSAHSFTVEQTAPARPELTAPAAAAETSNRPVFRWDAAVDADGYEVWVRNETTGERITHITGHTDLSATPAEAYASGEYTVWIRAHNGTGPSAWSLPVRFYAGPPAAPVLTTEQNPTADESPQFFFSSASTAAVTELWVNQVGGTAKIIHLTDLTGDSYTPDTALPAGTYHAWARSRSASGKLSLWSSRLTLQIRAVPERVLIQNISGTAGGSPTIEWNSDIHAARYEIWVARIGEGRVVHDTQLTGSSVTITPALASGSYRVWLRAFNPFNQAGSWSAPQDFTIS